MNKNKAKTKIITSNETTLKKLNRIMPKMRGVYFRQDG